jgi:hypothetical protein
MKLSVCKFEKKEKLENLDPELWGKLPLELWFIIKEKLLEAIKWQYLKRPWVIIRIRIDLFEYISFYFCVTNNTFPKLVF